MISAQQEWDLLLQEVGDDGTCQDQIDVIWESFSDKASIRRLQRCYTKRTCLEILLGKARNDLTQEIPNELKIAKKERFGNLQLLWTANEAELTRLEKRYQALKTGAAGPIAAVSPRPAPGLTPIPILGQPDGNDPRYRGDLYQPTVERIP